MSEYMNGKPMVTGYDKEGIGPRPSDNGTCIVDMCFEDAIRELTKNGEKRRWQREHKREIKKKNIK